MKFGQNPMSGFIGEDVYVKMLTNDGRWTTTDKGRSQQLTLSALCLGRLKRSDTLYNILTKVNMRNVTLAMHAAYLQWLGSWCRLGGVRLPRGSGARGPPCQEADRRAGRPLKCSRARIPSYTCVKETCMSCLVTTLHAVMVVFVLLLFLLHKSDVVI